MIRRVAGALIAVCLLGGCANTPQPDEVGADSARGSAPTGRPVTPGAPVTPSGSAPASTPSTPAPAVSVTGGKTGTLPSDWPGLPLPEGTLLYATTSTQSGKKVWNVGYRGAKGAETKEFTRLRTAYRAAGFTPQQESTLPAASGGGGVMFLTTSAYAVTIVVATATTPGAPAGTVITVRQQ